MWRSPRYTLAGVAALALGLGANFSIFAVYDALVMKPLPLADADRVVRVKRWSPRQQADDSFRFPLDEYRNLRDRTSVFSGVVASYGDVDTAPGGMTVMARFSGSTAAERMRGRRFRRIIFAVLGETPRLGIFPAGGGSGRGRSPVMVLTWRFWQRRLGGDPAAIGQTIRLNGLPYTVIGVAPEGFTGTDFLPMEYDFWAPLSMVRQLDGALTGEARVQMLARLKGGVSAAQAQSEATVLAARNRNGVVSLERTRYMSRRPWGSRRISGGCRRHVVVVCLVLGAACANVANMQLVRAASRQREIAIRLAMGAGRGRVMRQLLLENVLLSTAGGIAAIPLGCVAVARGPALRLRWTSG